MPRAEIELGAGQDLIDFLPELQALRINLTNGALTRAKKWNFVMVVTAPGRAPSQDHVQQTMVARSK
jgi:hypothetical protein